VGVEGEGVGLLDPGQELAAGGGQDRRGAEGAVDVEPQPLGPAQGGQVGQGVDAAGAGRARGGDHAERLPPGGPVGRDRRRHRLRGQLERVVAGEQAHLVGTEAEQPGGPADPGVGLVGGVQHRPLQPVLEHRPPGRDQAVQVGRGAAVDEQPAGRLGQAEQLPQPAQGGQLGRGRAGGGLPGPGEHPEAGDEGVGQHADVVAGDGHVGEEAWVVDPHGRAQDVADGPAQDLLGVGAGPGHRLVQQPDQLVGPGPPRRRAVPEPGQGVHDQVDDLVAEPPHLLGGQGERGLGSALGHGRSSSPGLPVCILVATAVSPAPYPEPDEPRPKAPAMDPDHRPEHLLGVLLDAYWATLANDPLPALLLTGLLSLAGVLVVLLGHIVGNLVGQLV
jgi:hypothetical protein